VTARLGGRLRVAAAGWGWTTLWMVSWAVSWVLVRLRPRPGQHCATDAPDSVPVPEFVPAPVMLPRTLQPSASEITVFDGQFGELRVRPFLEADHTWSDT
jgi:hypothetical protein